MVKMGWMPTGKETRVRKAKAMKDWRAYSKKRRMAGITPIGIGKYVQQEMYRWTSSGGKK